MKVFLEDYAYLSQLMINLYEVSGEISFLNDAQKINQKTWDLFYDKNSKILQKNPIDENDLFVSPTDISDLNIPNGNSIFLMNCKKLEIITGEKKWQNMTKELTQSFHSFLNLHATQMTSYLKNLDMCEELTSFTFFGNIEKNKDLHEYVKSRYKQSQEYISRFKKEFKKDLAMTNVKIENKDIKKILKIAILLFVKIKHAQIKLKA